MTVRSVARLTAFSLSTLGVAIVGCGPTVSAPKVEAPAAVPSGKRARQAPSVEQELGSIDERAVEQTFRDLAPGVTACHGKGRERVEYLAGDAKVFLRIGKNGRVRYGWFEQSTLGDRETERCIFNVYASSAWPKPEGGEAEVRTSFGFPSGDERPPTSWTSDRVTKALDASKEVSAAIDQCRAGLSGAFRVTAYVEAGDEESPKRDAGRFKAIGIVPPPTKEAAEKVDCLVEALKGLKLPSPGSYAAKVEFSL